MVRVGQKQHPIRIAKPNFYAIGHIHLVVVEMLVEASHNITFGLPGARHGLVRHMECGQTVKHFGKGCILRRQNSSNFAAAISPSLAGWN